MTRSRIMLLTAALAAAMPAQAQDFVLVHGFGSGPGTWMNADGNTVAFLQANFPTHAVSTPSYPWWSGLNTGAASLSVDNPATSILIAHSEGGLVSRKYAETHFLNGLLTMGTPQYGANMATNYPMFLNHVDGILRRAGDASNNLWALQPPFYMQVLDYFYEGINTTLGALQWIPDQITNAIGFVPVVADLQPGSGALQIINGDQGLPNELTHIPAGRRASLHFTEGEYYYAPELRVALGNQTGGELANALIVFEGYTWDVYDEARDEELSYDPFNTDNEDRYWALVDLVDATLDLAVAVDGLDFEWCADISMSFYQYWNAPNMWCSPNDLFIATDAMLAPGADDYEGFPVMHTAETRQGDDIQRVLQLQFLVP